MKKKEKNEEDNIFKPERLKKLKNDIEEASFILQMNEEAEKWEEEKRENNW